MEIENSLLEAAKKAREYAYCPYSGFKVGAAVLGKSGRIYTGCNIENVSYGLTNCAERTAIFKGISAGEKEFEILAVTADTKAPVAPCGACRQVMAEFRINRIIMSNMQGKRKQALLEELLPFSFDEEKLRQNK
ncbi:cytidine deaminase [Pectinatus haikarae]|uniref:Cytidine deaminase n=1 Tax=Pectinatus haikarae TaxID=349096 RepID=A0ABT9Y6I4_9FIRM|nr:cytidine deaminase [Pectinatus haikarae]MDQ0203248.1 cytidine deaminase [Pectinatus haikarae]